MSKFLVGKTLEGVKIASDKKAILFETSDGEVIARADGDCCSSTWIEHIDLPALGFPCKVVDITDKPLGQDEEDEFDVIRFYGCQIITDKGDMEIEYRNASNGYYGGDLVWPDDEGGFYGGVHGQNVSNEKWVEV